MVDWLISVLTGASTAAVGLLAVLATRKSSDRARIVNLEARVDKVDGRNARMQNYVQTLREHISRGQPPPPPPFPDDLFQ